MFKIYLYITLMAAAIGLFSCNPQPEIDDVTMLDGTQIFDASINEPEKYLVSAYLPEPTDVQKDMPVLICAHGFSATTFEWDELRSFANEKGTFYVSQVLLGGHGRTYADFKQATWPHWQQSLKAEYENLVQKGFRNIYFAGSSTGGTLLVEMISSNYFHGLQSPKGFFLIDPIVVPSNKDLTLIDVLGPILGYTTSVLDTGEVGKWYVYRPQEALKQLMSLIDLTRKRLERGIILPDGASMKIYHSDGDKTADPVSSVLLYKGIKTASGKTIDVKIVNSPLHVFTRLHGRDGVTYKQRRLQANTFAEIEAIMTQLN